jgi:hypothetical protein
MYVHLLFHFQVHYTDTPKGESFFVRREYTGTELLDFHPTKIACSENGHGQKRKRFLQSPEVSERPNKIRKVGTPNSTGKDWRVQKTGKNGNYQSRKSSEDTDSDIPSESESDFSESESSSSRQTNRAVKNDRLQKLQYSANGKSRTMSPVVAKLKTLEADACMSPVIPMLDGIRTGASMSPVIPVLDPRVLKSVQNQSASPDKGGKQGACNYKLCTVNVCVSVSLFFYFFFFF